MNGKEYTYSVKWLRIVQKQTDIQLTAYTRVFKRLYTGFKNSSTTLWASVNYANNISKVNFPRYRKASSVEQERLYERVKKPIWHAGTVFSEPEYFIYDRGNSTRLFTKRTESVRSVWTTPHHMRFVVISVIENTAWTGWMYPCITSVLLKNFVNIFYFTHSLHHRFKSRPHSLGLQYIQSCRTSLSHRIPIHSLRHTAFLTDDGRHDRDKTAHKARLCNINPQLVDETC